MNYFQENLPKSLLLLLSLFVIMKTLYKIACRNQQGQITQMDDLLDRVTVARVVRELNERCSRKKVEYFAEPIDITTLPCRVLTNLFQENKITYEELSECAGANAAEHAMELKRRIPARSPTSHGRFSPFRNTYNDCLTHSAISQPRFF